MGWSTDNLQLHIKLPGEVPVPVCIPLRHAGTEVDQIAQSAMGSHSFFAQARPMTFEFFKRPPEKLQESQLKFKQSSGKESVGSGNCLM